MKRSRATQRSAETHIALACLAALAVALAPGALVYAQDTARAPRDAFRQLEEVLPTPNGERTAAGAPGPAYWQQRADYRIEVELDDETQSIRGHEWVTYHNRSPHALRYLWVQLDANIFRTDSDAVLTAAAPTTIEEMPYGFLESLLTRQQFEGGVNVQKVADRNGEPLAFTIVKTMMRIDMPGPLLPDRSFVFEIAWQYEINNHRLVRGRTGYEYFEEDDNYLYEIAQWFPRLAAYTDVNGWQHKQFLGAGEFTLELGDYEVEITVPADHVVAATGSLQNPREVLSARQRERLEEARHQSSPVFVITPEEARANESSRATEKKTWIFHAENVRDFAFASSRKFIWDAQGHTPQSDPTAKPVMAMSFYPKEGEPLWSRYSTHAIVHTLDVYSRYAFPYPYPVAISVNGPVGGMEYPMICFNGPRPEKDGTYSPRSKYGLISVIIHEVGHNWFPMIVNSDERQWTWMDEGLNSFLQYLAEQEWEENYPSRRGEPHKITEYTASERASPIMTNSESVLRLGPNAYAKPATALNVLRETVLGRELFDYAFREYSRRWMFKRPMPADFFRTMEDATSIDLDWFWRGWFYGADPVDIAVTGLQPFVIDSRDPEVKKAREREDRDALLNTISESRNRELSKRTDAYPELRDFYNQYDELDVTADDRKKYLELVADLSEEERRLLTTDKHFTVVDFENVGGVPMPLPLRLEFEDGSSAEVRIPAEIWRRDVERVSKLFVTDQPLLRVVLDPRRETADVDLSNNSFPPKAENRTIRLTETPRDKTNPMREARELEVDQDEGEDGDEGRDGDGDDDSQAGETAGAPLQAETPP